jgi:SWI/SNF-related matrix-associated actin-dependent regulator of chromatin subfamily A containing DEAD/H box 1
LLKLLAEYAEEGRKVLIFSQVWNAPTCRVALQLTYNHQFTQILDILQAILRRREIVHLLLTGSTPVDVRQSLVDEFTEVDSISVFLLSTKAGGKL